MTEYGKALVAAACQGSAMPGETCCGAVDWCCERPPMVRALLAAIDRLIEAGPSEGMALASGHYSHRRAGECFTAMLRALRAEIEEGAIVEAAK